MPDFTVTAASIKRDNIEGKYGLMRDITLTLVPQGGGEPLIASWYTKATTDPPAQGAVLSGDVTDGEYGKKFKKAQQGFGGPRPEDPKRQAMIVRQHSQSAAIALLGLMHTIGVTDIGKTKAEVYTTLTTAINWLDDDAKKAGDAA